MAALYNKPADVKFAKHTPLLRLSNYMKMYGLQTDLLLKVDAFNPLDKDLFSKRAVIPNFDHVVPAIIEDAEKAGLIDKRHTVLVEPCFKSGVGLAWIIQRKGYKLILTMPDTVSKKHISLIKTLDAIVVLTPGDKGIEGALKKAKQLRDEIPGAVMLEQFADKIFEIQKVGNIWEYACDNADILVVSKNTDKVFQSQICNLLSFLKVKKPNIKTVSVESEWKKDLSFDKPGYDIDETITVESEDASETAKEVAITEGLILDMLSGAVVNAATLISQREENFNKTILAVLQDTTERNISTTLL